jgi:1,4-alpha-glucan branching enzyme
VSLTNNQDKVVIFEKNGLLFCFNFNYESYKDYKIGTGFEGDCELVFSSDEKEYGGYGRVSKTSGIVQKVGNEGWNNRKYSLFVYLPSRSVQVYKPIAIKKMSE